MIDLNRVLSVYPAPYPGVIIEQHLSSEGWLQFCLRASNLAGFSDPKRQDIIVWSLDLCQKITAAGNPIQFVILDE